MPSELNTIAVPATRVGGYSPLSALNAAQKNVDLDRKRRDEEAAERDAAAVGQVMSQHPEDPDTAIKVLKQTGFHGAAAALQKRVTEERTKMSEFRGQELENLFKTGQVSAQQVEAEYKALTRGREEDWRKLYDIDPEGAMEKAPFMLGAVAGSEMLARFQNAQTSAYQADTSRMNAETARMQAEKPAAERGGGSDYAQFLTRHAASLGKTVDQLTSAEELAAKKQWEAANDRPVASGGGSSRPSLSPAMESNIIHRLTTQWTAAKKPAEELARAASLMNVGMQAARRGDIAAGSQAVLVTFQKILDPTSVVRESEYMRSAAGQSLMNRVAGAYERMVSGGTGVRVEELEKFKTLADEAVKAQTGAYLRATKDRIGRTADRYTIPRDVVFEDVDVTTGTNPAAAKPDTSGIPEGKVQTFPNGKKAVRRNGEWHEIQ